MESPSAIISLLGQVPQFQAMTAAQLDRLYGCTALAVLAKGEAATLEGRPVDDLRIVLSGRLAEQGKGPEAQEFGKGAALAARAFFTRSPAPATLVALRETVLVTLSRDDLFAAFQSDPDLLEACFAASGESPPPLSQKPSRIVLAAAGAKGQLDAAAKDAFVAALETQANVRLLRRDSFGSLALDAPDAAHWLQEQELEFEATIVVADGADAAFAKDAVEEGDEIVFLACGGGSALSALEQHALDMRGKNRCRLVIAKGASIPHQSAVDWVALRPYRSTQFVDLAAPKDARLMASALLGKGVVVAATSSGVYAAAILGALQALEASGLPALCLAAGGSAVLPAGMLSCGASLAETEVAFQELAEPTAWKRASRLDVSLYEAGAIDAMLALALPESMIGLSTRPFVAVSLSLSDRAPRLHREGSLLSAVRAGLTPPGVLPPFISEANEILVSGESEAEAIAAAVAALSPAPLVFLYPAAPPLGLSEASYRQLTGPSFRLAPFQALPAPEKRLRLETVLGAASSKPPLSLPAAAWQSFAIPIPEGISPMDWPDWAELRDVAFEWTFAEIVARGLAQD